MGKRNTKIKQSKEYLFAAFDQETEADYFATVGQGIDRHRLKIYDVRSGNITHDYDIENGEDITSLSWGTIVTSDEDIKKKKSSGSSRKKSKAVLDLTKVVSLGTEKGTILIYSLDHDKVIKTLKTRTDDPIADMVYNEQGTTGYSISNVGTITEWNIREDLPNLIWKTNESKGIRKAALSPDQTLLAVAGNGKVELWEIANSKLIKVFEPSSNCEINQLVFSKHNDVLICKGDNSLEFFNSLPTNDNTAHINTLTVDGGVKYFDIIENDDNEKMDILVVSGNGMVHIWQSVNILKEKKSDSSNDTWAKTRIKVLTNNKQLIPISWARFTKTKKATSVVIGRESTVKPLLETVGYTNALNRLVDNIVLTRQPPNIIENQAKLKEKEDNEEEETTNQMEMNEAAAAAEMEYSHENFIQVMKLDDRKKTIEFLKTFTDKQQVKNLIHLLPKTYVHTLAIHLSYELERNTIRDPILIEWLKQLALVHYNHLMNSPLVVKRLSHFSKSIKLQTTTTLQKSLALRSRIEMIQQQIYLNKNRAALDELDANELSDSIEDEEDDEDEDGDDDEDNDIESDYYDDDVDFLSDNEEDRLKKAHIFDRSDKDEEMDDEEDLEEDLEDVDSDLDDSDASM